MFVPHPDNRRDGTRSAGTSLAETLSEDKSDALCVCKLWYLVTVNDLENIGCICGRCNQASKHVRGVN